MRSSFGCLGFFCCYSDLDIFFIIGLKIEYFVFSTMVVLFLFKNKIGFLLFDFRGMKWVLFCFFVLNIYVFSVCVQAVLFSIQE